MFVSGIVGDKFRTMDDMIIGTRGYVIKCVTLFGPMVSIFWWKCVGIEDKIGDAKILLVDCIVEMLWIPLMVTSYVSGYSEIVLDENGGIVVRYPPSIAF
jgi:hypothetical protein